MDHRREWAAVAGGFVALALVAAAWVAIDRRPPDWDHANHLERAVRCAGDLARGDVRAILERSSFYPPLVPCLAGAVYLVAPSDAAAAQSVIVGFLGLGMAAVYLLGRALAGGRVGVAAALLFGTAPFVVFSTLRFQLDLPLASMVALALLALVGSDGLTRRGPALAFGLVAGLGLLTKPTFPLYVAPPAIVALARGGRRGLGNAALAVAVAAALGLPWFGPRLLGLGAQLDARAFAQAAEAGAPPALSRAGLTFYLRFLGPQLGFLTAALFLVGLAVALVRRQWLLLTAVVAPFVVLELIQNKNLRYALPLLAAAAVVAALALDALPARARRGSAVVLAAGALLQVGAIAAGVPPNVRVPGLGVWWVPATPPVREDWRHREILALIDGDRRGAPATVSIVPNAALFSTSNFRYYAVRDGRPLKIARAWDDPPLGVDYMVFKTGEVGPAWTEEKSRRAAARLAGDAYLARVLPVIGEFPLPDGSTATVRARRIPPVADAAPAAVAAAVEAALRRRLGEVARDLEGLDIRLDHDADILGGRVRRVEIRAAAATLGELTRRGAATLRVRDIRIVLDDLLVNPWSAVAETRLDPLDAGRVRIEAATITQADLQAFVAGLKRFRRTTIAVDGDALAVAVRQTGPDVTARVRLLPAPDRPFAIVAERVRVGGVPVPGALVNWVIRNYDPTPRLAARLPFPVEIGRVSIGAQAVRITRDGSR
jgi:hypothetical protein